MNDSDDADDECLCCRELNASLDELMNDDDDDDDECFCSRVEWMMT